MARIRTIKPEFWSDDKVVGLSFGARLLFIGLWNFADDEGYLWFEPDRLKRQIFPDQQVDHMEMFRELIACELLRQLQTDKGKTAIHIVHFLDHQKVQHPTPSKISHEASRGLMSPHEASLLNGMEWKWNGREGNGRGRESGGGAAAETSEEVFCQEENPTLLPAPTPEQIQEVFDTWNACPNVNKSKFLTELRRRQLLRKLREPVFANNWREVISKISKSEFFSEVHRPGFDWLLDEDKFIKTLEGNYDHRVRAGPSKNAQDASGRYDESWLDEITEEGLKGL